MPTALAGRVLAVPALARLSPARNLRLRLGLILSSAAIAVALAITALVSTGGERRIAASLGQAVGQTAFQMADVLDRGMFERYREVTLVSGLQLIDDPTTPATEKRQLLEIMQATFPDYAWIGLADADGTVVVATGGVLETKSVAESPWFASGLQGPFVGSVREDPLLAPLADPDQDGESLRVVDVAAPLRDAAGTTLGVLGAQLSFAWVRDVEASLLAPPGGELRAEIFIVDADGGVLLAPAGASPPASLDGLESVQSARAGRRGFQVEQWPDGGIYVVGYAPSRGFQSYPGLGWTVLVRQNAQVAYQPIRLLQQQILTLGLATALLLAGMGWFLAGRLAGPMVAIAAAARRIERGERGASIPKIAGHDELALLSQSLDSLVESLRMRERELQRLAAMHEQRVRERTADLEEANRRLEQFSSTDALTGVANRRLFDRTLDREWRQLARSQEPLSLIMIDIDHFKGYNDTYGHQQGDECLRQVAGALYHTATRAGDLVARYGGEEFAVILSHTDAAEAMLMAEKLRRAVFELRIPHKANSAAPGVSISLGVATMIPQPGGDPATLIAMADRALYRAKSGGRDRAVQEVTVPPPPPPDVTETDLSPSPFPFRRARPREP